MVNAFYDEWWLNAYHLIWETPVRSWNHNCDQSVESGGV